VSTLMVQVRGLAKQYKDGTWGNHGIDLDVGRGEIVAILGPNGAGKTTFLRQLTTELKPTSGSIRIADIDAVREPQRAKQLMGITPQEAGLFESLTVREHLELFGRLKGLTKKASALGTAELLEELDLISQARRRIGTLSGGQQRRVLIGLAMLGRQSLLVLDEPTTGLDPASRRAVWHVLVRAARQGASVILSTHYIEEAERLSDRIAIISAGVVIACGTIRDLAGHRARSLEDVYFDLAGDTIPAPEEAVS
jgi:ABC-2 type transport system ATP-binding protein